MTVCWWPSHSHNFQKLKMIWLNIFQFLYLVALLYQTHNQQTSSSSPTSTDWKFPTQTNVHAARVLKPPTTSCNPAPPSMTWDARHGPVRWRPTGSFGDRLRHCGRLRTLPYSPDWKSSMAWNAEEQEEKKLSPTLQQSSTMLVKLIVFHFHLNHHSSLCSIIFFAISFHYERLVIYQFQRVSFRLKLTGIYGQRGGKKVTFITFFF